VLPFGSLLDGRCPSYVWDQLFCSRVRKRDWTSRGADLRGTWVVLGQESQFVERGGRQGGLFFVPRLGGGVGGGGGGALHFLSPEAVSSRPGTRRAKKNKSLAPANPRPEPSLLAVSKGDLAVEKNESALEQNGVTLQRKERIFFRNISVLRTTKAT